MTLLNSISLERKIDKRSLIVMVEKQLTISVAAYNAEDYLDICLQSFIASGVLDALDVIVVNDGSKDSTIQIAEKYSKEYPDSIRVIDKPNGGHGSTIITSIPVAMGRYYKIVDSDDWLEPESLKRYIEDLKESNEDLIVNHYYYVYTSGKKELITYSNGQDDSKFVNLDIHSLTIKTNIIKQVGPIIDEHCFYVDTELAIFPMKYVKTIKRLDYPLYDYLIGREGQSVDSANMLKRRDQLENVTKRCVDDYLSNQDSFKSTKAKEYTYDRLIGCTQIFYWTLMLGNGKNFKQEIVNFDSWLRRKDENIYNDCLIKHPSNHNKYLRFCRKTKYIFYGLTQKILNH